MSLIIKILATVGLHTKKEQGAGGTVADVKKAAVRPPQVDYPPTDEGLPLSSVEELVQAQEVLISRIRTHASLPAGLFEVRYMKPIRNLAAYVLNLPATEDEVYGGPGGLFRSSLELAFFAYQASDGSIFTGKEGVETRHLQEPRWRYICFVAGLIWPIGKSLENVRVTANGVTWPSRTTGLESWQKQQQCDHVYLTWQRGQMTDPGPSVNGSAIAVSIIGQESIEWIEQGSPRLMTATIELSSGLRTDYNSIAHGLLDRMWQKCLMAERSRMPANYGRVKFGQHMAPHIVDAMAKMLNSSKWVVNQGAVHVDATGVYLVWPQAGKELAQKLQDEGHKQTPSTDVGMLTMLIDEGLLKIDAQGGVLVDIADQAGEIKTAVKLLRPNSLIPDYRPEDFTKSRQVTVDQIVKQDPIAQLEIKAASQAAASSKPAKAAVIEEIAPPPPPPPPLQNDPLMGTLATEPRQAGEQVGAARAQPKKATKLTEVATPESEAAAQIPADTKPSYGDKNKQAKESAPVTSYKDHLPTSVVKSIANGLVLEQLARLHLKIKKPENMEQLIFTADYVAVPWKFFENTVVNPPNFLTALGEAGYLYFDPTARGKKMHEIPIAPDSTQKVKCFLLAKVLTSRLGLSEK